MSAVVEMGDLNYRITGDNGPLRMVLAENKKLLVGVGVAITGAFIGAGAGALKIAGSVATSSKRIAVSMGLPIESAGQFRKVIKEVYGDQFGESMGDVGRAVQDVAAQLKGLGVTAKSGLKEATESALALRDTFDVDVGKSTEAVKALMSEFGLTAKQAFDFVTTGFTRGLDASDDFLKSITEYSNQFSQGGANAGQFFSLLESGMKTGVLGTDKAADLFKEFQVRILDGSKSTSEALAKIGIDSETFLAGFASGQTTVAEAFTVVQEKLLGVTNQSLLMQSGVGLMGTQFEDLGAKAALALDLSSTKIADLAGSTDKLNAQYDTMGKALEGIRRRGVNAWEEMGAKMLPFLNEHLPGIEAAFVKLEALAPAIGDLFGKDLDFALNVLVPVLTTSVELATAFPKVTVGAMGIVGAFGFLSFGMGAFNTVAFPAINLLRGMGTGATIASGTGGTAGLGIRGLTAAMTPLGAAILATGLTVGGIAIAFKRAKDAADGKKEALRELDKATERLVKQLQDQGVRITAVEVASRTNAEATQLMRDRIDEAEDAAGKEINALNGIRTEMSFVDSAMDSQMAQLFNLKANIDAASFAYENMRIQAQQAAQFLTIGGVQIPNFTPQGFQGQARSSARTSGGGGGPGAGGAAGFGGGDVTIGDIHINTDGSNADVSELAQAIGSEMGRSIHGELRAMGVVV